VAADEQIVVIDLETTGTDLRHEIVEIALVGLGEDLEECWTWHELVRPLHPEWADPVAMAVHGIDEGALRDAKPFAAIARDLSEVLRDVTIAGHNPHFDGLYLRLAMVKALGERACRWRHRMIDTGSAAFPFADLAGGDRRLDALCAALGIERPSRHRALADARAAAEVLRRLRALAGRVQARPAVAAACAFRP
jgi:DNA polymerase III subunit epsilon